MKACIVCRAEGCSLPLWEDGLNKLLCFVLSSLDSALYSHESSNNGAFSFLANGILFYGAAL